MARGHQAPTVTGNCSLFVSEDLFPSGPWIGFYNYRPGGERHWMELNLNFANGALNGDGKDDVGLFFIRGRYDAGKGECHWTKTYVGRHEVFYHGFREGKGLWGRWEIGILAHGGFHIWPRGAGESEALRESASKTEVADAVGTQEVGQPETNMPLPTK